MRLRESTAPTLLLTPRSSEVLELAHSVVKIRAVSKKTCANEIEKAFSNSTNPKSTQNFSSFKMNPEVNNLLSQKKIEIVLFISTPFLPPRYAVV